MTGPRHSRSMPMARAGRITARAKAATVLIFSRRSRKWTPKALGVHFRNYPDPYSLREGLSMHEFSWKDCVSNFTLEQTRELASQRGVAELTIKGLHNR